MKLGFIDIEASGLGDNSFPLEIGWTKDGIDIHEFFIKPHVSWDIEEWDPNAENLHGISKDFILENGINSIDIALIMNEHLSGYTLLSDSHLNDIKWINKLFVSNEIKREFKIVSIDLFLNKLGLTDDQVHQAFFEARKLSPPNNSVYADVKFMFEAVTIGMNSVKK